MCINYVRDGYRQRFIDIDININLERQNNIEKLLRYIVITIGYSYKI